MGSVHAPDGRTWEVGRRWLPRPPRLRRRREPSDRSWLEPVGEVFDFDGGALTITAIVLVVVVAVAVVTLALEIAIFVLLVVATLVGRLAFRRPWQVVARTDGEDLAWEVVGWRASGRTIEHVEQALRAGETRPRPPEAQPILAFRLR